MDGPVVERIRALVREPLNWEWLTRTAVDHGVFPLLYDALQRNAPDAIPPSTVIAWRSMFFRNAARNLYLVEALAELMGLLQKHGIRAIAYKGPALSTTLYANLTLRWAGDLDLLVHPNDFSDTKILLAANGYKSDSYSQWWHECEFAHPSRQISLDLHRSVVPRRYRLSLPFDDIWDRRRLLSLNRTTSVFTVSIEDLLEILSLELIKEIAQPTMLRLIRITDVFECLQQSAIGNCNVFVHTFQNEELPLTVYAADLAVDRLYGIELTEEQRSAFRQECRLSMLVGNVLGILFLDNGSRPSNYIHQVRTILAMHRDPMSKAVVTACFILEELNQTFPLCWEGNASIPDLSSLVSGRLFSSQEKEESGLIGDLLHPRIGFVTGNWPAHSTQQASVAGVIVIPPVGVCSDIRARHRLRLPPPRTSARPRGSLRRERRIPPRARRRRRQRCAYRRRSRRRGFPDRCG
ncbi:MAG: nucleotidyltransferase family protein [Deltaproteobacteria bacterium]|nr:nucleotidyltransferase family protein [Deltaproteobacteria bacterium]